jgi:hypothetical protein
MRSNAMSKAGSWKFIAVRSTRWNRAVRGWYSNFTQLQTKIGFAISAKASAIHCAKWMRTISWRYPEIWSCFLAISNDSSLSCSVLATGQKENNQVLSARA